MLYEITRYFIVSGFEYYAMLCLTYAFFRLKPWKHTKEILFTVFTLSITTIFNIFVVKSDFYFSTFLIVIIIVAISFYMTFKRFDYAFLSVVGIGLFLIVQTFVLSISMMADYLSINDIFLISSQGEMLQIISSATALFITFILQIENSGFSYQLNSGSSKFASILIANMCPISLTFVYKLTSINNSSEENLFVAILLVGAIALVTLLIFSNYFERQEYSKLIKGGVVK